MIYEGKAITATEIEDGIVEFNFDLQGESVNKFNRLTLTELSEAVEAVTAKGGVKGALLTSGKKDFIVGADITEFGSLFKSSEEEIATAIKMVGGFSMIEDLPFPTVAVINGLALGGGFEVTLACDYRVMSSKAKVGLPEVKLGLIPGWGGTVRLPRIIGADNAIEWICATKENRAPDALKMGGVDAVAEPDKLLDTAMQVLKNVLAGKLDYQARRAEKTGKLKLNNMESMMVFETAKGFVRGQAGPHYPAPVEAIKVMQKHAGMERDKALEVEAKAFAKLAKTEVSGALIGLFHNDQHLKKVAKEIEPKAAKVGKAAVLGAGIMGGGIAYQSALKGTPIIMKDINQAGIDLGLAEAKKLLSKRVDKGRMKADEMGDVLNRIDPTLTYGDFGEVDVIVEAVVENPKVKHAVLTEVEGLVREDAIIASNTSTISIDHLAEPLKRKQNFLGMHFFNPVHKMPLVEIIRGKETSEEAVASVLAYAKKMGKQPVVVNDGPGFFVNRVLFPYFFGFSGLVMHGVDFQRIDKVAEKFGWPMGPAYLNDVVGMDTAVHAAEVMSEGFPDRMKIEIKGPVEVMFESNRLGQKNNLGFYKYELDKKGRQKKVADEETYNLINPIVLEQREVTDEEIMERMMVPLCLESVRCLEDGIIASPAEGDMGLIFGIGFPPHLGGAFRYMDTMGLDRFVEICDKYAELGALYSPTEKLREMAKNGEKFFA